jgi:succinate-semialdehyde dehydrogenase/glutarate-semialdehyde dehydrogenase
MFIQTINPVNNKAVKSFDEMTDKAINAAVGQAETAFISWRKTSYQQRAALLQKVARIDAKEKTVLAELQWKWANSFHRQKRKLF